MKRVRVTHLEKKKEIWMVIHDLQLVEGRLRKLRPIHVFTLLAPSLVKIKSKKLNDFVRKEREKKKKSITFKCCWDLENKLYAVRFLHFQVRAALAEIGDPVYPGDKIRIQDFDDKQKLICLIEAYLSAIYSALELTSKINHLINPSLQLPQNFRRQSHKYNLFNFSKWVWLENFLDIRAKLTHDVSPIIDIENGMLIIHFEKENEPLEYIQVSLNSILYLYKYLFELLDLWAIEELKKVDPETEIASISEKDLNKFLNLGRTKAREILDLLKVDNS